MEQQFINNYDSLNDSTLYHSNPQKQGSQIPDNIDAMESFEKQEQNYKKFPKYKNSNHNEITSKKKFCINFLKTPSLSKDSKDKDLRILKLFIYICTLLLTVSTYAGWTFFAYNLEYYNVYAWLCEENQDRCNSQLEAIQILYTFAVFGNYGLNFLAGASLNILGPKITALLGMFFICGGYTLIALSGEHFNGYPLAFFFIGTACDFLYYPSFTLMNLFPSSEGIISGTMLGAGCISWLIPNVQLRVAIALDLSSTQLYIGYSLIIIPFCLLFALFLPWYNNSHNRSKQKSSPQQKSKFRNILNKENDSQINLETNLSEDINNQNFDFNNKRDECQGIHTNENISINLNNSNEDYDYHITQIKVHMKDELKINNQPTQNFTSLQNNKLQMIPPHDNNSPINSPPIPTNNLFYIIKKTRKVLKNQEILVILSSKTHLMSCLLFSLNVFRYTFFVTALNVILGPNFALLMGYISPLSCFLTPIYGLLLDKIGFGNTTHLFNTVNLLIYITTIFAIIYDHNLLKWLAIIMTPSLYGSFLIVFMFTTKTWGHVKNYVLVVGVDLIIASIASYMTSYLYGFSLNYLQGNFIPSLGVLIGFSLVSYVIIYLIDKSNALVK